MSDGGQVSLNVIHALQETLIVVTADHSHVMTMNGYPSRGQDITGFAQLGDDKLPYTTLMYTNGPGFNFTVDSNGSVSRVDISEEDVLSYDYKQQSAVPAESETHGGEDVAIYAIGPMSHLFRGVHQQNFIAHAMSYAACVGQNKDHCKSAAGAAAPFWVLVGLMSLYHVATNALLLK
ncbi:Alkaline phosphatase [Trinorchestia longiramus]|nr:Alkaline phosphatase [Trinorchestia longiramus]